MADSLTAMEPKSCWAIFKAYIAIWARIIPEVSPDIARSQRGFIIKKEVQLWRRIWRVVGILALLAIWVPGLGDERVPFYLVWGVLVISCSAVLVVRSNFPGKYIAAWRWGICGVICIFVPYIVPGFAWAVADALHQTLSVGDPWFGHGLHDNGVICLVAAMLNLAICYWVWHRSREKS